MVMWPTLFSFNACVISWFSRYFEICDEITLVYIKNDMEGMLMEVF